MKNMLHILIVSLLFSIHTAYPQELTDKEKIGIITCIATGCGILLYFAHYYKNEILTWLMNIYKKIYNKKDDLAPIFITFRLETPNQEVFLSSKYIHWRQKGCNIFHLAANNYKALKLLLSNVTDIKLINQRHSSQNGYEWDMESTPLHRAVMAGNLPCIFLLLEHGADLTIPNRRGDTPLTLLCKQASYSRNKNYRDILTKLLQSRFVNRTIIDSCQCLCKSIIYASKTEKDDFVPKLLLEYGANPNQKSSPLLLAARYNLPLLHLILNKYKGDYLQQDDQNQTMFYKAFMFQGLEDPNQLHFFQNLDSDQKKDFMFKELQIVANFTPKNIWGYSLWSIKKEDFEIVKRFNSFITACAQYGNVNLNKIFFFNIASQRAKARQESFNSSARPIDIKLSIDKSTECSKYWCMHKDKDICHRIFDEGHPNYQCADCKVLFPINEVIVHAFARHIKPIKAEQKIHKQIAITYQDNPGNYY